MEAILPNYSLCKFSLDGTMIEGPVQVIPEEYSHQLRLHGTEWNQDNSYSILWSNENSPTILFHTLIDMNFEQK